VEAGGSQRWMNSSRWRLEEVGGGRTIARGGWRRQETMDE